MMVLIGILVAIMYVLHLALACRVDTLESRLKNLEQEVESLKSPIPREQRPDLFTIGDLLSRGNDDA